MPGKKTKNSSANEINALSRGLPHKISLAIIILVWGVLHYFSHSWGLPNLSCFPPDTVPMNPAYNSKAFMQVDVYRYPPLQYLIWDWASPPIKPPNPNSEAIVAISSKRIGQFRLVVSVMTLGTALALYVLASGWLKLRQWSVIAPLVYLLNPCSLFYAHTTNMDQPYVFWFAWSWVILLWGYELRQVSPLKWHLANAVFGILVACSFCTKDHVYASYLLPCLLIYIPTNKEMIKTKLIPLFYCLISFFITIAVIYKSAGGYNVFHGHFSGWTSVHASTNAFRYENSIAGRGELLLKSLTDVCVMLDWPTVIVSLMCVAGALFWWNSDRRLRQLLIINLVLLLSIHILFLQLMRFTFPRFYLPLIISLSLMIAYAAMKLHHHFRFGWGVGLLYFILIAIIAGQLLHTLVNDSHIGLRKRYPIIAQQSQNPPLLGLEGITFGKQYGQENGKTKEINALRDWSLSRFGFINMQQVPIAITPMFLALVSPDFAVLYQYDGSISPLMKKFHYQLDSVITPPKPMIPSLFKGYDMPIYPIYRKESPPVVVDPADITETFEQQLLIFQLTLRYGIDLQTLLQTFGRLCSEFSPPDIQNYSLEPEAIYYAILAYNLNGRMDSMHDAYRFFRETYPDSPYAENLESYFSH